jgi:hypothetical protein
VRKRLAILLLALAATAGCGGGGDGDETSPQRRLEQAVADYERAVADQDCRAFARYAHSAVRPPGKGPEDPPDPAECRRLGLSYTALADFKSKRTKVYGPAAIVEGTVEGRFFVLIWVLDVDGRWVQVQAAPGYDPQIRSVKKPQERFVPNAAAFVQAQRAGDCGKVFRLLSPAAPFVTAAQDDQRRFCQRFREGASAPDRLANQLTRAPSAKPVDAGGTKDLHFFTVDTGGGRRWVLILSTLPIGVVPGQHLEDSVLDYFPTAPAG